jgi:Domain of unknown function (DUF4111)
MESPARSPRLVRLGESRLPAPVAARVDDLLTRLDRALPGRVEGFYVVGSACLGAFREGRSDIDFVAIADRGLRPEELRRLHAVHLGRWAAALVGDVALRRRWPLVCNGSYLERGALSRSPREVTALAGHVAGRFATAIGPGGGFDVNPVTWHMLARHGIAVRGAEPDRLEIRTDPAELRVWTRENLDGYWRAWVTRARRRPSSLRALSRWFAASGVLGVSRLHYTLLTGEIASKEAAGEHALAAFAPEWRPLIEDALAFWRGAPPPAYRGLRAHPTRRAAEFVAHVIDTSRG